MRLFLSHALQLLFRDLFISVLMFGVQDGTTPVWTASKNGHLDVVQYLHQAGADINLADEVYCKSE